MYSLVYTLRISEPTKVVRTILQFEWDQGNRGKNFKKHKVTDEECEEAFFDSEKRIPRDRLHSDHEERLVMLGKTKRDRLLFIVFTTRNDRIRVISARGLSRKEGYLYYEEKA